MQGTPHNLPPLLCRSPTFCSCLFLELICCAAILVTLSLPLTCTLLDLLFNPSCLTSRHSPWCYNWVLTSRRCGSYLGVVQLLGSCHVVLLLVSPAHPCMLVPHQASGVLFSGLHEMEFPALRPQGEMVRRAVGTCVEG